MVLLRIYGILLGVGIHLYFIRLSISLVGGTLVSLISMRQMDLKSLIPYLIWEL